MDEVTKAIKDYDPEGDVLYLEFSEQRGGTGIHLTSNLVLFVDLQAEKALRMMILDFSKVVPLTEGEPLWLPTDELEYLPKKTRIAVENILTRPPLSEIIELRHITPRRGEQPKAALRRPTIEEVREKLSVVF